MFLVVMYVRLNVKALKIIDKDFILKYAIWLKITFNMAKISRTRRLEMVIYTSKHYDDCMTSDI